MKITDIYTLKDSLYNGHIEGETLYNKAHKYGRYDICLLIASRKRQGLRLNLKKITDFKKNVNLYEDTGKQQYKDKATGRYYHRLLWQGIINYIAECKDLSCSVNYIKKRVLRKEKLPTPWHNDCYACLTSCDECPISKRAGICYKNDAAFSLLCDAVRIKDREAAVKYASIIMEAWDD